MTSKTSTKVRLVRCPRCRLVLPELPGVSLYRCGGCSTVLQAKNRKGETKDTRSSLHETDAAQSNESKQVSEEKEPLSAIQKASVPSTGDSALDQSRGAEQKQLGNCNSPSNDFTFSTGLKDETKDTRSSLKETVGAQKNESEQVSEEKVPLSAIQKASVPSTGDSALDQSRGAEQKELGNCSSPSDDVTSSTGLKDETKDTRSSLHESDSAQKNESEQVSEEKVPLSPIQKASVPSTGDSALDQSRGTEQKELRICNSPSNDVSSSTGLKDEIKDICSHLHETDAAQKNESEQVSEEKEPLSAIQKASVLSTGDSALDQSQQKEFENFNHPSNDVTSSTGLTSHENEEPSLEAETHIELDEEHFLDRNKGRNQDLSGPASSLTELNCQENDESSSVAEAHMEVDESKHSLKRKSRRNENEFRDCNMELPEHTSVSIEVSSSTELTCHENEETDYNEGLNFSGEISSSTKLNCQESDETSSVAEADIEVNETKYSLKQKNGRNQNESGDPNVELLETKNVSKEFSSSTELTCHENEAKNYKEGLNFSGEISSSTKLNCKENDETSSVAEAHIEVNVAKYSLKQKNGRNQNEFGDLNVELLENMNVSKEISSTELTFHENKETNYDKGLNFCGETSSSTKLNCTENEESSPVTGAHIEADETINSLEPKDGKNQNEFGDHYRKWSEASSSTELTCHENEEMNENVSGDFNGEQGGVLGFSGEVPSSTELNCQESEESFEVDENKHFLEQKNGRYQNEFGDFNKESPSIESVSNEVSSSTELTCHEIEVPSPEAREEENLKTRVFKSSSEEILKVTRQRESISSDNLTSSPDEQVEQSQKIVLRGFDRVSSVDTLENTQVNPSTELNNEPLTVYRSPTARRYYGYDGSVSSCDGIEDQFLDRRQNVSSLNTKGIPKRGEYTINNMINCNSEMKHQTRYSSSVSSEKKNYAVKGSKLEREEWPGPTRHHDPTRNRIGIETDAYPSTLPFYLRDSRAGYGNGSPSSSNSHSPDKHKYLEKEKMELLRMVYDLQNQLNRLQISKENGNGMYPSGAAQKERKIPSYYGHSASEEEDMYHDPNNPRYLHQTSRMPFSGNVTNNRHQSEYSCFHGCPEDWHYSSHLPPHDVCCSKGHKCQNPHLSSPERFSSSQFSSRSCDTTSGDQRYKNHEKGSYLGERNYLKRRHFRPIAGGAPFVACYNCSKLLQMPADFLLFRRKFHRLTCSACSTVLKFSLNRSHLVPYTPGAVAPPPPTDIDHISNIICNANDHPNTDRVSCSDDYDQSYSKSCSTEGESSSLTPPFFGNLERKFNDRKMPSGSSFESVEYRKGKSVLRVSENKYKTPVENFESAGSSEIQELPPKTGSPLHRLMGYSSPSQVIKW